MAMRVTQGMTNRSYLYNLNTAQYNMNKSSEKLQTGRKYSRVSEDVHGATKCLTLRAKLYRNDRVQQGVAEAINEMDMAESTLTSIKDIASNVQEEMIKAMDEPKLTASKSTFLAFLQQSKENILGLANKQYNDKYLLGDLKAGETPFTSKDGYLQFRGYDVSSIRSSKIDVVDENLRYIDNQYERTVLNDLAILDVNNKYTGSRIAHNEKDDDYKGYNVTEALKNKLGSNDDGTGNGSINDYYLELINQKITTRDTYQSQINQWNQDNVDDNDRKNTLEGEISDIQNEKQSYQDQLVNETDPDIQSELNDKIADCDSKINIKRSQVDDLETAIVNRNKKIQANNGFITECNDWINNKYPAQKAEEVATYQRYLSKVNQGYIFLDTKKIDKYNDIDFVPLDEAVNEIGITSNTDISKYTGSNQYGQFKTSDKNETQDFYYMFEGTPLSLTHDNYIDVGLDMSSKNTSASSKFDITIDGLGALGFGTNSETGISNNLYDMLTEMEKAIELSDTDMTQALDRLGVVYEQFKKQTDNLVASISEVGTRGKYLETTLSRLENENSILKDSQTNMEATDDALEITRFRGYQNAWNMVLQLGGNIIPKSLMDYVN